MAPNKAETSKAWQEHMRTRKAQGYRVITPGTPSKRITKKGT